MTSDDVRLVRQLARLEALHVLTGVLREVAQEMIAMPFAPDADELYHLLSRAVVRQTARDAAASDVR